MRKTRKKDSKTKDISTKDKENKQKDSKLKDLKDKDIKETDKIVTTETGKEKSQDSSDDKKPLKKSTAQAKPEKENKEIPGTFDKSKKASSQRTFESSSRKSVADSRKKSSKQNITRDSSDRSDEKKRQPT